MPVEIERKFLVCNDLWRPFPHPTSSFVQGYFSPAPDYCVRIRLINETTAYLTIKGNAQHQRIRPEFEYSIPFKEAQDMLSQFCGSRIIRKLRHLVSFQGFRWEIDEFLGQHAPLVVAELELSIPDERFPLPPWVGKEVTDDDHYSNQYLALHPQSVQPH